SSFKRLPARASLLYARSIPPVGGHTEFADERAAYDALPEETKRRLDRLVAEHSIFNSRARLGFTNFNGDERRGMPPGPQVVVRTLPASGRKSLSLASHAGRIFGMPEHEGRALIDQLVAHATQRQFVHTHRWRINDLVMWDNRCTMHRGTEFDDLRWKRDVQRATVCDVANSCEQEGIESRPRRKNIACVRYASAQMPRRCAARASWTSPAAMHSTHKLCITRSMICRPCFSPRWQSNSIVLNQVSPVPM